jgi:hypothetical protein
LCTFRRGGLDLRSLRVSLRCWELDTLQPCPTGDMELGACSPTQGSLVPGSRAPIHPASPDRPSVSCSFHKSEQRSRVTQWEPSPSTGHRAGKQGQEMPLSCCGPFCPSQTTLWSSGRKLAAFAQFLPLGSGIQSSPKAAGRMGNSHTGTGWPPELLSMVLTG